MEVQKWLDILCEIFPESPRRRRVRASHNIEGMRGDDGDGFGKAEVDKSGVDGLHCGEEIRHELGVVAAEDFVADEDEGDFGLREVRGDVLLDPILGLERVSHVGEELVSEADDEVDLGVGEGLEDVGIGVVEFDSADVEGLEEHRYSGWGRQVVGDLAVVDAVA